ncbi:hypothetical protein BC829DRAFT_399077 [Chytridium lagenaria]|nr:hypothetical protein BC829DRAFT_399077 [Chytridium lagenaria]
MMMGLNEGVKDARLEDIRGPEGLFEKTSTPAHSFSTTPSQLPLFTNLPKSTVTLHIHSTFSTIQNDKVSETKPMKPHANMFRSLHGIAMLVMVQLRLIGRAFAIVVPSAALLVAIQAALTAGNKTIKSEHVDENEQMKVHPMASSKQLSWRSISTCSSRGDCLASNSFK